MAPEKSLDAIPEKCRAYKSSPVYGSLQENERTGEDIYPPVLSFS